MSDSAMNGVVWGFAWVLAAMFFPVGLYKLVKTRQQLIDGPWDWAEDFSARTIKLIGVAEILGAIGLVLPPLVDVAPLLSPIAACGLLLMMIGAFFTHIRREEHHLLLINAPLMVLLIVVIWGRFGPYNF